MLDKILSFAASFLTDAITPKSATIRTGTGAIKYIQFGKLVVVAGTINVSTALAHGTILASGLPTGISEGSNSVILAADNNATSGYYTLYIGGTGGELRNRGAITASNKSLRFTAAYIAA